MFVKPIHYFKIMSETDLICLWEIVHANFGAVGITIDAGEYIYILLGRNRQMSRALKLPWEG